jgi:hypothetical protein
MKHKRTLLFGSTPFKHGDQFDYRNRPMNMRMRVCHLDCHEGGLCCYLVIHIENLFKSIAAVLLVFVTHFLAPPRNFGDRCRREDGANMNLKRNGICVVECQDGIQWLAAMNGQ